MTRTPIRAAHLRSSLFYRSLVALLLAASFATPSAPTRAQERVPAIEGRTTPVNYEPVWVLSLAPTLVWTGPTAEAVNVGTLSVRTPLQVLAPQEQGRLYVLNTRTNTHAWVDAPAVAPIPEPTAADIAAYRAPDPFEAWWGMPFRPTSAWSDAGSDASEVTRLRQWLYLRVTGETENGRVPVVDARSEARFWVNLADIGPVGAPPPEYLAPAPADTQAVSLPGRIVGSPFAYDRPYQADHFSLGRRSHAQAANVVGVVEHPDGTRWYRIGTDEYVQEANVRVPRPPERTYPGRWIDANLNEPVLVTAYEGDRPVYAALAVKGTEAFRTPTGVHRIQRRVANETMDSATIGIPRSAPLGYYLQDVLYTQYFTGDGAAIHYNYWRSDWGYSGSKGCLGMSLDDSRFFWDFASVGTVVSIHF